MSEMAEVRKNIPKGKTRVVWVDLFDHEDGIEGDYDDRAQAFSVADENNKRRTGDMDTVYYVYDDTGDQIRGDEVSGHSVSP